MPDGRGWHPDVMTRAFARLVKRSGLAAHPSARPAPHARDPSPRRRHERTRDVRAPRPRVGRVHPRRLRPRPPRPTSRRRGRRRRARRRVVVAGALRASVTGGRRWVARRVRKGDRYAFAYCTHDVSNVQITCHRPGDMGYGWARCSGMRKVGQACCAFCAARAFKLPVMGGRSTSVADPLSVVTQTGRRTRRTHRTTSVAARHVRSSGGHRSPSHRRWVFDESFSRHLQVGLWCSEAPASRSWRQGTESQAPTLGGKQRATAHRFADPAKTPGS